MKAELIAKIQSTLTNLLVPVHKSQPAFKPDENMVRTHLNMTHPVFFKNQKPILKLSFWSNPTGYKAGLQTDAFSPKCRVSLTYQDGSKEAFCFPQMYPVLAGVAYVLDFYHTLLEAGAELEPAFLMLENRDVVDWLAVTADETHVKGDTATYYNLSRSKIANLFVSKLKTHSDLLQQSSMHGMQVFSFGCGLGSDIKAVRDHLQIQLDLDPDCYGLDINPENFENAPNGISFNQVSFEQLEKWLPTKVKPTAVKLGLFMGALTHSVSPSTYACLSAMHTVRDFNLVIIGVFTPILLNKSILKAAGWEPTLLETSSAFDEAPEKRFIKNPEAGSIRPDSRAHYILLPMSQEKRKEYLQKRGTRRSSQNTFDCLDLSCSSNPIRDLSLFEHLDGIKQVDISWTNLPGQDLNSLLKVLEPKLNREVHLIASGDEPWFEAFKRIESNSFKKIQRLDHKVGEIAPYAAQTAKRIGIHERLPYKPVP